MTINFSISKDTAKKEYYKALEEAVHEVKQSTTRIRKDVAKRLFLGVVAGYRSSPRGRDGLETVLNSLQLKRAPSSAND